MRILPIQNYIQDAAMRNQKLNLTNMMLKPYEFDTVSFGSNPKDIRNIKTSFHNPIQIVFSDIDETISRDSNVSAANLSFIKKLHQKHIPLILCTGRTYDHAKPLFNKVNPDSDYYVTQQGAAIFDKNGDIIYENHISEENTRKIIDLAQQYQQQDPNVYLLLYFGGKPYSKVNINEKGYKSEDLTCVESFDVLLSQGKKPNKAFLIKLDAKDYSDLEAMKKFFRNNLDTDLNVFNSAKNICEITNSDTSKGIAIKFLADRLGIDLKNAAAFGDAENDLSMMQILNQAGGLSVAMANGTETLKTEAKFIAPPVTKSGFAKTINKILKNNKQLNK